MSTDKSYVYGTEKEEKQLEMAEKNANDIKNMYEELMKEQQHVYDTIYSIFNHLKNMEPYYLKVSLEFDRMVLLLTSMDQNHTDYKNTLDAYNKAKRNLSDVNDLRKDTYEKNSIVMKKYSDIILQKEDMHKTYMNAKEMVAEASKKLSLKKDDDQKMKEQSKEDSDVFHSETDRMLHKIMIARNTWVRTLEKANIAKEAFMKELKKGRALGLFAL